MHPTELSAAVARAQRADRLADAARARSARPAVRARAPRPPEELVIRAATPTDRSALEKLRQLDGRPRSWAQDEDLLVALVDGALVAAVGLTRIDHTIADPFRRTAGVVELLRRRAQQLAPPALRQGRHAPPVLVRAH